MATGRAAADSSVVVTHTIGGNSLLDIAKNVLGSVPTAWGRYFTSTASKNSVVYRPAQENVAFNATGTKLIPIARQTLRVGGSKNEGAADGAMNAEALIAAFGADLFAAAGNEFLMFLDVEGPPHSLSAEYYAGWSTALQARSRDLSNGRFVILPCVYATQADNQTWRAVVSAGTVCAAAWVARWRVRGCSALLDWKPAIVQPSVPLNCPVVIWQYADECHGGEGIDCDELNPDPKVQSFLLDRLLLPPAHATGAELEMQ
ncbi:MAG TPA: hypothetical protein VGJ82_01625 [Thermoanaerobaculia bacterium]|jgi:hypothetical protein